MLVRSSDGKKIARINKIEVVNPEEGYEFDNKWRVKVNDETFGIYSDEERAVGVLSEIEDNIYMGTSIFRLPEC